MKFVIVSGRSGSGKSILLHVLEDLGYYCIDNLPLGLLRALPDELSTSHKLIAVSIDARNLPAESKQFHRIVDELKQTNNSFEIIFLDAGDPVLIKRFSETRRKHPLTSQTVSLQEALTKEGQLLQPLSEIADLRIDTSQLTLHDLSKLVHDHVDPQHQHTLSLLFKSFGYKYGIPVDSDYIFDVRCLPNPHWQPEIRAFTGKDEPVIAYLQAQPQSQKMVAHITHFLETWLPCFEAENRSYLTIAVGCTGGQHRSVYIVEQLAAHFIQTKPQVQIRHREL